MIWSRTLLDGVGRIRLLGAVACAAAVAVPAIDARGPVPTPIGPGGAYRPAAHGPLEASARCLPRGLQDGFRMHLELFANRRVIIIPAGIGLEGVRDKRLGSILAARCRASTWTLDPTGVVRLARGGLRLRDLFAAWRQPLAGDRLLSFRSRAGGELLVFRNGKRWRGSPGGLELRNGDEVVVELNGYVKPHRSYVFPPERR